VTGRELRAALTTLRWTQVELSRRIDMAPHSVGRWVVDKDGEIPGPVAAYVGLALRLQELAKEIARCR
jgi:hypothetical protein